MAGNPGAGKTSGLSHFVVEPDPDNPGWDTWEVADRRRFNAQAMGKLIVRREGDRSIRLRMFPEQRHSNLHDNVHGGVTLALIDIALFAAARQVVGADAAGSVTLDLSNQFIGTGQIGMPLDCVTDVMKETRRLVFLRGVVEQESNLVASFTGVVRKPSRAPSENA